ncbi:right-handed parallel beta-helix repeat-containing protein [Geomonas sp. RF6]|uniref:right-handed parallel beta-helix repeat-containing protein n=1 Tax=Geomonas sp. RF6 TaxID=2897342 RepID=UPI001E43675B|nr:right-handed parallel beta-helix repeat-containing protein [Geomonas sp. RF6]UFS68545.1 right-handed parallel beta-helix repeat-containing protein [Geomonas sp. RF6]
MSAIYRQIHSRQVEGLYQTLVALLLLLMTGGSAAARDTPLPPDRIVKWQGNVGVLGDIPVKNKVFSTLSPSGADDTLQLQGEINRCTPGQVLELKGGTFKISRLLSVKSGIVIRGAGAKKTVIKGTSDFKGDQLMLVEPRSWSYNLSRPPAVSLESGYRKGSTTITTISEHRLREGDVILIDQMKDPDGIPAVDSKGDGGVCTWCGRENGARPLGQLVMVKSTPDSTTVELEIPLYWSFKKSLMPELVKVTGQVEGFGLEDLTLDNGDSGAREAALQMNNVSNSWVHRVEMIGSSKELMRIWNGYRITVRGCTFHEGIPVTATSGTAFGPSRGYGIWINPGASACLIEHNEFYHLALAITANGTASGNVFSYNYIHDLYHLNTANAGAAISFHGAHPMMNLIEGNYSEGAIVADNYWGSSSTNTIFRNRIINESSYTCQAWAVNLHANQQQYNVVGNILGAPGDEERFEREKGKCDSAIYNMADPVVKSSAFRHANWDSVHKKVLWYGTRGRSLPPSLYLSGAPKWWGRTLWPPVGPEVSAKPHLHKRSARPSWWREGRGDEESD